MSLFAIFGALGLLGIGVKENIKNSYDAYNYKKIR